MKKSNVSQEVTYIRFFHACLLFEMVEGRQYLGQATGAGSADAI
jgi:hypothetical protein